MMIKQFVRIILAFGFVGQMKHFLKAKLLIIQRNYIFQLDYTNHKLCLFVDSPIVSTTFIPLRVALGVHVHTLCLMS
jgi:hypothetical protein